MVNWYCLICQRTKRAVQMHGRPQNHRGICTSCHHQGHTLSDIESSSSPSSKSQRHTQQPLFEQSTEHYRISIPQRYTIIVLHLLNKTDDEISHIVNCHIKTVRRWIHHFNATGEFNAEAVEDAAREGNTHTHITHSHTHTSHTHITYTHTYHTHTHHTSHVCMVYR